MFTESLFRKKAGVVAGEQHIYLKVTHPTLEWSFDTSSNGAECQWFIIHINESVLHLCVPCVSGAIYSHGAHADQMYGHKMWRKLSTRFCQNTYTRQDCGFLLQKEPTLLSLLFCVLVFDFITYFNQFFTLSSGRFYCLKILNFTGFSVTFSPYNLCSIEAIH